jgi:hypothetical protein
MKHPIAENETENISERTESRNVDGLEFMENSDQPVSPGLSNPSQGSLVPHFDEWISFVRSGNLTGMQSVLLSSQVTLGAYSNLVQGADEMGMTALHWAAREGQYAIARYLVQDAAANVFAVDFEGMRASEHARDLYYMDLARYLEGHEMSIQNGVICMQVNINLFCLCFSYPFLTSRRVRMLTLQRISRLSCTELLSSTYWLSSTEKCVSHQLIEAHTHQATLRRATAALQHRMRFVSACRCARDQAHGYCLCE